MAWRSIFLGINSILDLLYLNSLVFIVNPNPKTTRSKPIRKHSLQIDWSSLWYIYIYILHLKRVSRHYDVTILFWAFNRNLVLICVFPKNVLLLMYFWCLSSVIRSFPKLYKKNQDILGFLQEGWTLSKQIRYFLEVFGNFLPNILSTNVPYTFSIPLETGRLVPFRKPGEYLRQG